jgi:hypothetical protein
MRTKAIVTLCCFLTLLLAGVALFAEAPQAPAAPVVDNATAPVCAVAPVTQAPQQALPDLGIAPETRSACPVSLSQTCVQRYGQCALCYCIGASCSCENRCV